MDSWDEWQRAQVCGGGGGRTDNRETNVSPPT